MVRLKHHKSVDHAIDTVVRELGFTRRQREIIFKTMLGLSEDEISEDLGITKHTLRAHKSKIFIGTTARNQLELTTMINRVAIGNMRSEIEMLRNGSRMKGEV